MDKAITFIETVRWEVSAYASEGYDGSGAPYKLYYVENPQEQVFSVVVPYDPAYRSADLVMMTGIVNGQVIIDIAKTCKPLYNALEHAGIPEDQIVLAWSKT